MASRHLSYDTHSLLFTNDSDSQSVNDDFVSFPTLPDPEQAANRSFSKIITKTLRKVTNNASNLVHTYASPRHHAEAPDVPADPSDSQSIYHEHSTPNTPVHRTPAEHRLRQHSTAASFSSFQEESSSNGSYSLLDQDQHHESTPSGEPSSPHVNAPWPGLDSSARQPSTESWLKPVSSNRGSLIPSASPASIKRAESVNGVSPGRVLAPLLFRMNSDLHPRVTSDNKSLRLSTMGVSKQHAPIVSQTDVTVSNTDGEAAPSRPLLIRLGIKGQATPPKRSSSIKSDTKALQNRISSIFNNLPNDIELSDDSASDIETINNDSISASPVANRLSPRQPTKAKVDIAPVKLDKQSQQARTPLSPPSSASVLVYRTPSVTRKISANLSSSLLDSAKSIINNNITGKGSSSSSIIGSMGDIRKKRKKKRIARKLSDNPLKNGGIPKKYWMNDSFVSDCLNCFKPFSAFRRKHHCRFCGQIFCSSCTLFISYSQYKHEKMKKKLSKEHKVYNDKLRVCKPCYSDVIVYLSDDSLSSSEEAESDFFANDESESQDQNLKVPPAEHPLVRYRSRSVSSRRDSVATESLTLAGQQSSRKDNFPLSGTPTVNSTKEPSQRSSEVTSYKHAPQMAIPTTRTGEAIEIPVSRSPFTNSNLPVKQNLAALAMRNAVNNTNSVPSLEPQEEGLTAWYSPFHDVQDTVTDVVRPNSLENLGKLYNSFLHRNPYRLTRSTSERMTRPNVLIKQRAAFESERDDDNESENEDEKVMSLYTSLNNELHGKGKRSSLSPRAKPLSQSMSLVPTLHEFPAMNVNDKYIPSPMNFAKQPDEEITPGFGINANKNRSDHRSSERAKASLNRMRQKRMNKLRNRHDHAKTSLKLPQLDTTSDSGRPSILSPQTTPTSPIPLGPSILSDHRDIPNSSLQGVRTESSFDLSTGSPLAHKGWDEKTSASEPYLHEDVDFNNAQDSHANDGELIAYFGGLLPTIDKVYDDFMHKLLLQSLADCDIADPDDQRRWGSVLFDALRKVYQLKISDTLDIKQYVKFKKISGGAIEDTHVVDGLFITKNIDSKRMQLRIEQPRIALLMFPLEYLKHKEQFISLRIVGSQQSVYIGNLVSRLISLEPDIIVVGDSVCGLALKLLEEANVTVLSNVKPQVIERISRYTRGDIFSTVNDLFFKKGSLGSCSLFEVRKFIHEDTVKTYSFFTGCDTQYGFTICLRGSDSESLSGAKYTTETLTPALWNAKFEKGFFITLALAFQEPKTRPGTETLSLLNQSLIDAKSIENEPITNCLNSIEHYGIANYIKLFTERFLSVSPSVNFGLPGVLLNVVNAFVRYIDFACFNHKIQLVLDPDSFEVDWLTKARVDIDPNRFNGFDDIIRMLRFVCKDRSISLLEEFNTRMRNWSNSIKYNCYQLYPIFHRSIHVLYSTVSIKHATPCTGPVVVVIDYHTDNDKCLGVFLDQALQESGKVCEDCNELLLDHYKTYVHDNAKVDLIIERVDSSSHSHTFKGKDERIMWSHCPECNYSTPISYMNDEIYYLSLGKFFELSFWSDGVNHDGPCSHDYFKKHVKYFGYNDVVIRMEYSKIETYEVVVPRKRLESTLETDIRLKIESFERISKKMEGFFLSISGRLNRVKLDTADKAEAGYQRVEELKERVTQQLETLSSKLLKVYEQTLPTNYVLLNAIQRDLQDIVVEWDTEFNEFESDFLPTENEITKITQSHLRNFLIDKLDNDGSEKRNAEKAKKEDQSKAKSANSSDSNLRASPESIKGSSQIQPKRPVPLLNKFRVPSAVIEDKISQIQQSFENDNKGSFKSPDKSCANSLHGDSPDNSTQQNPKKVQDLTNYFNQMTLEFQRQREEALEKKSYKYKTLPIVNSLPIVEIYGNIEDVVDVNQDNKRNKLLRNDSASTMPKLPEEGFRGNPLQEQMLSQPTSEGVYLEKKVIDRKEEQKHLADQNKKLLEEMNKSGKDSGAKQKLEIPQPERNSLLKSLMNYWADRSATLWDPLDYPFDVTEHTFADSDVIVREDEPSSLVAFCLSSSVYKQKIQDMAVATDEEDLEAVYNDAYQKKAEQFTKIERKFKKNFGSSNRQMSDLESTMVKAKTNHLKYQFSDGNTMLSCKIFYSEQFDAFRRACGLDQSFIQSLSRCIKWNSKGGKSGSNFLKTLDNRYIVKELLKSELESFVSIAPFYFKYISQSTFNTLTTAIAKIFGFYQIEIKNSVSGKTFKMDFLIMENLFYNRKCSRIFDLKGSMRNRHVQQTGKENEVLLDENMIEYIYESPVFVKEQLKKLLRGSLFNDTSFLSAMDVMDYSLVVGIDDSTQKLCVGIIDWLRTFTWDKKVENWVKGSTLVGKKGKDPTIVTPKQYRIRFREAMDRYILEVPDIWYEGKSN